MSQRQYQALASPLGPHAPNDAVATDSWQPVYPARVIRKTIAAACLAVIVAPVFIPNQTSGPDHSWRSNTAYPDRIHRRVLPRAAHLPSAQDTSPIPTPVFASGGSFVSTGAYDLWQYQAITGPLDVPAPIGIEAQGWRPQYPDVARRLTSLSAAAQRSYVTDTVAGATAATAPDYSSLYNLPTGHPRAVVQTYRAQAFANDTQWLRPADAVDQTGWRPQYPPTQRPTIYARACYTWAQPHYAVVIQVPVMSWTGMYLDPPVLPTRSVAPFISSPSPLYLADITVVAPESSWQGQYPARIAPKAWSLAATTAESIEPIFIADLTTTAPTLSARAIYPDRIHAKPAVSYQREYQSDKFTAPTVVAAPDLAVPVFPDRVYGKPVPTEHPAYLAPEYVLDVTLPAPELSWAPAYPDQATILFRAPHLLPGWENDSFRVGEIVAIPLPPPPDPVLPETEIIGTYVLAVDVTGSYDRVTEIIGTTSGMGGFSRDRLFITGTV